MKNIKYETTRYYLTVMNGPSGPSGYNDCKSTFEQLLKDKNIYGIRLADRNEDKDGNTNLKCLLSFSKLGEPTSKTPIIIYKEVVGYNEFEIINFLSIISIIFLIVFLLFYFVLRIMWKK